MLETNMELNDILKKRKISRLALSQISGVPYATLSDICNGKTRIEKCSGETLYQIARALHVSIESLIEQRLLSRPSFETFKSSICHRLKELNDVRFVIDVLENDEIRHYYDLRWLPECLYLLAMIDYLCRINSIDLCSDYDDLRTLKLPEIIYPESLLMRAGFSKDADLILSQAYAKAIPEFTRFNIVEDEVRNVV
jgi:transcriptional regulator with XRE-family HTH domain